MRPKMFEINTLCKGETFEVGGITFQTEGTGTKVDLGGRAFIDYDQKFVLHTNADLRKHGSLTWWDTKLDNIKGLTYVNTIEYQVWLRKAHLFDEETIIEQVVNIIVNNIPKQTTDKEAPQEIETPVEVSPGKLSRIWNKITSTINS